MTSIKIFFLLIPILAIILLFINSIYLLFSAPWWFRLPPERNNIVLSGCCGSRHVEDNGSEQSNPWQGGSIQEGDSNPVQGGSIQQGESYNEGGYSQQQADADAEVNREAFAELPLPEEDYNPGQGGSIQEESNTGPSPSSPGPVIPEEEPTQEPTQESPPSLRPEDIPLPPEEPNELS